jgi:hypothetical protein
MEKQIHLRELEFVESFAKRLKNDNSLFQLQKQLIESHLHSLDNYFKNKFGDKNFKENAREYLKKIGLI